MRTLENKVVLITGAGSGLGRALALEVAAHKGVPVLADIDAGGLEETRRMLDDKRTKTLVQILDIRDPEAWNRALQETKRTFGGLDVLVNNAGVLSRAESFLDVSLDHCRFVMEVNFWGMFHGVRAAVPLLAERKEAHIVNTASSMALIGAPMHSVYSAAKAGVSTFSAVLREELRGSRINVTVVYPGATRTGLGRNVPFDDEQQRKKNAQNFERFARTMPEHVAKAIVQGTLHNKPSVVTGMDGRASGILSRLAPGLGYRGISAFYRKVSDPALFQSLDRLR